MLNFKPTFSFTFHFHKEALHFLFSFCHKGGVICISEVIDIYPENLDPAYALSDPAFCMRYSTHKLDKQGDSHTALKYSFPSFEPVCRSTSSSVAF